MLALVDVSVGSWRIGLRKKRRVKKNPLVSSCLTSTPGQLNAIAQVVGGFVLELFGGEGNRASKALTIGIQENPNSWFSRFLDHNSKVSNL